MIPAFPKTTKLTIAHQEDIQKIASQFLPYSDFNFTSLFCWDTNKSTEISLLNNNLIIKLPDYLTGQPLYSLFGNHLLIRTVKQLLTTVSHLELVPQETAAILKTSKLFKVKPDRNNFDYIYSLQKLSALPGKEFRGKRKGLSRFKKNFASYAHLESIDFSHPNEPKNISHIFSDWAEHKGKTDREIRQEADAIQRLLQNATELNLVGYKLSIGDHLAGFVINEQLGNGYTICHFQKTVLRYPDIDTYLSVKNAALMKELGYRYSNWEQDLGLPGLREMKLSYKPIRMLKKYTVSLS